MTIYLRITQGVREHLYVRRSEWACATVLTWWAIALLTPGNTFDISPTYVGLRRIASEHFWGLTCASIGGLRLAALTANGTFKGHWYSRYSPYVRAITAYLTAMIFLTVVIGILTGPTSIWPLTTALGTYATLAWLDIATAFGTAKESGWTQRENRGGRGGNSQDA